MNIRILPLTLRRGLLLMLAAGLAALPARAQTATTPPNLMTYQGYLTDGNGSVLGGTNGTHLYDVVFRIYDAASAGTELYSEIQTITVNNGYFSALLGLGNAFNAEPHAGVSLGGVFATNATSSSLRYIEMMVLGIGPSSVNGGNVTLAPRLELVAAPFAFTAASAVNAVNLVNAQGTTFLSQTGTNVNVAGALNVNGLLSGNGTGLTGVARLAGGNAFSGSQYVTNGSVGLGTITPVATLEVNGTLQADGISAFTGGIRLNSTNGYSQSSVGLFSIDSPGFAGGRLTVLANGNVGIGTAGPSNPLTVNGNANVTGAFNVGGTASAGSLSVGGAVSAGSLSVGSTASANSLSIGNTAFFGGWVGMGTSTPGAGLDVENEANNPSLTGAYFTKYNVNGSTIGNANLGNNYISIMGAGFIQAYGFVAVSDRRIKDIVARSDSQGDLGTIQKLQVTDYRMKDRVEKGDDLKKGFIAQEVAKVIPEAVTMNTAYIPDIYALADHFQFDPAANSLQVTLGRPHALKSGDLVRLITEAGRIEKVVSSVVDDRTFVLGDVASAPKQVFIYGRQVHDFLSVDYNRIYTTGIGAIQELAKRMEQKDAQVAELKSQVSEMKTQFAIQQAQMADLKKMVVQLAAAGKDSKFSASAAANGASAVTLTTASVNR